MLAAERIQEPNVLSLPWKVTLATPELTCTRVVDLYADPKAWHPDVDDLDIPVEQADAVRSASKLLDVELPLPLRIELGSAAAPMAL